MLLPAKQLAPTARASTRSGVCVDNRLAGLLPLLLQQLQGHAGITDSNMCSSRLMTAMRTAWVRDRRRTTSTTQQKTAARRAG